MQPSRQAGQRLMLQKVVLHLTKSTRSNPPLSRCIASNSINGAPKATEKSSNSSAQPAAAQQTKKKTQAELDKELELKMKGLAGDGGESGVEYEDGQPVSMKRSVKNNMFRYI